MNGRGMLVLFCLLIIITGCGLEDEDVSGIKDNGTVMMGGDNSDDAERKTQPLSEYIPLAAFQQLSIPEQALDSYTGAGCYYGDDEIFYVDTAVAYSDSEGEDEASYTRSCLCAVSADGTPCFLFSASQNLAIYAESPNKEGAWAFMEFLLSADEQSWYSSENDVFPVRRDAFEAYLARAYSFQQEALVHSLDFAREDTPGKLRYMAEHLGMDQNDGQISAIVTDELQAFFARQKTADETAKVIQNRVQLYLNEMQD